MADNSISGFTAPQADVEAAKTQTGFVAPESDSLLGHIRSKSVDELYADKTFRPDITLAQVGAHNLAPEDVDKLTEVYRRQAEDGFDWARVPGVLRQIPGAVKDFVKGGVDLAKRIPVMLDPSPYSDPIARTKAAAELAAAVESGSAETAGLIKSGARKVGDFLKLGAAAAKVAIHGDGPTAEEIYQEQNPQSKYKERLFQAAAEHDQQQKTYGAKGEIAKAIGLDADKLAQAGITVDEDAINRMSDWGDVSNLTAIGAGWGVVAKTGKPLFVATTKEAAESFSKRLGEKVAAAGRGITDVGQKLSAVRSGEAGALVGALTSGSLGTGALIGAGVPTATKVAGKVVEGVGERIAKGPGPILRLAGSAAKGAAAGVVSTVPFAAAADYEEDAALIAGVGGGLGATSAAAHHGLHTATQAAQGGAHATAARAFRQAAESAPIAEHPAYGSSPELDADHAQAMEALRGVDPGTANLVDHIRTVLPALVENAKPGSKPPEVYLLEDSAFKKHFADTVAETQQGVFDHANNRIFLRLAGSDVESLHHEPGHLVFELLPQEQQQSVFNEIKKAYGEDGIKDFTQKYENWVNKNLPPDQHKFYGENYILTEIAAEHLASIIRGDKLDGTAPSLVRTLGEKATRMFEVLGLYKPETDAKPNGANVTQLGIGVSPAVTETLAPFFREHIQSDAVKDALNAPAAATPAPTPAPSPAPAPAPTPTPAPAAPAVVESQPASALPQTELPKADLSQSGLANPGNFVAPEHEVVEPAVEAKENIRVTPQEQSTLDVEERSDLNIAEAEEAVSSMSDKSKQVFQQLRESLRAPQGQVLPVEITYNSKEVIQDPTNRTTRREDQASTDKREAVQKLIVPTGFTPDGKQLTAMSPDKVLSNAERISIAAEKKGVSKLIPYETNEGTYTPESKAKFNKDLEAYLSNQAAGYRGNGKPLTRPENFEGFIPPQNPNYKPTILPDNVANFLNLVMGIAPPKTNRVKKLNGVAIKPTNVRARELATANLRIAQKPGVIGDPTKQNFRDFGNVEIAEFNPLRKALDEAGVNTRSRIEVTERLNLDQIEAVTPRSKSNFRAPVTDLISAGFMPSTKDNVASIEDVSNLSTQEFATAAQNWKGGVTGQAISLGKRLLASDLPTLENLYAQSREKLGEYKAAKDFEAAMAESIRGQFYREAGEAVRANNGEQGLSIRPEDTRAVAFQPRRDDTVTIDDFKDDSNISKALTRPGWAVLTATQEALGSGTDEANVKANEALAAELKEKGHNFVPVDGSYKGVDQGKNFLITGITPDEALELGKKYKQESILTNEGLVYGDGTHNPVDPAATFIGDLAKEQDFHSQIEGGPAFSLGIDFSKREPLDKKELTFMPGVPKKDKTLKDVKVEAKGTRPKKQKLLPKTWILPDGEVAHSANLHENYLADNSKDLNSRFGTKFADKPDQAEREQALRRGFVRVAYEANSGTMNVEVAENRWNKSTRDSVLSLATDNIGKIDNMRVSLLNDKLEVAKQDFARLFQYSDKKKLEHLPLLDATESPAAGGSDRLFLKALREDNEHLAFLPSTQGLEDRISTRTPWAKNAPEDASKTDLVVGLDAIKDDPKVMEKISNVIKKYPMVGDEGTPKEIVEKFVSEMEDNLLWLHDKFPEDYRQRARKWYDGARRIIDEWSEKYGVSPKAVGATLAVLSPQRHWFHNVEGARRVFEAPAKYRGMTADEKQIAWLESKNVENKELTTKQKEKLIARRREKGEKISAKAEKNEIAEALKGQDDSTAELVREIKGKKWDELTPLGKAVFMRSYEQVNGNSGVPVILPEGEITTDLMKNNDGATSKIMWGSYDQIGRAFEAAADPSLNRVSEMLGEVHKVRSFYNNMMYPNDTEFGDVTADTHAVAAGFLQPMSGSDSEVLQNFGAGFSTAKQGISGTYPLVAEAYRRAATKRKILPREMQSMTWEAVRALFKDDWKTAKNKALVKDLWKDYYDGNRTLDETRNEIFKLAGGFDTPDWADTQPNAGVDETARPADNAGDVSGSGLREYSLRARSGGRGGNSRDLPKVVTAARPKNLSKVKVTAKAGR